MMISASTSSRSKVEFSPSLSEVVTSVWPLSSSHLRIPSSFSVVPRRAGTCSAWIPPWIYPVSTPGRRRGVCGEGRGEIAHVVEDCQNFDLWVECLC